jgi:hypothetical protein
VASFFSAMSGLAAFALFLFAFSEVREGRLAAALAVGVLASLMSSLAAALAA